MEEKKKYGDTKGKRKKKKKENEWPMSTICLEGHWLNIFRKLNLFP